MQELPLLLVDVDGVLSTWGWSSGYPPDGVWTLVDGIAHHLSSQATATLQSVGSRFDRVWCTGWEERANEHLPQMVGLGPWGFLSFDREMGGTRSLGHWKLAAIDRFAGPDRPLAWVDDAFTEPCERWAAERPGPTLLVRTDPAVGMTAADGELLLRWADDLARGPGRDTG